METREPAYVTIKGKVTALEPLTAKKTGKTYARMKVFSESLGNCKVTAFDEVAILALKNLEVGSPFDFKCDVQPDDGYGLSYIFRSLPFDTREEWKRQCDDSVMAKALMPKKKLSTILDEGLELYAYKRIPVLNEYHGKIVITWANPKWCKPIANQDIDGETRTLFSSDSQVKGVPMTIYPRSLAVHFPEFDVTEDETLDNKRTVKEVVSSTVKAIDTNNWTDDDIPF